MYDTSADFARLGAASTLNGISIHVLDSDQLTLFLLRDRIEGFRGESLNPKCDHECSDTYKVFEGNERAA